MENVSSYVMFLILLNFYVIRKGKYTEKKNIKTHQTFFLCFYVAAFIVRLSEGSRMYSVFSHTMSKNHFALLCHCLGSFVSCFLN